jgi:decaprenylphospho-beta-D-erythro-pentofuranosid-2-ulose 2-reductase
VLGAGSDIAVALVAELASRGLEHALLAARDPDAALDAVAAAAPGLRTRAERWDALDVEAHADLVERARGELGGVDLVVMAVGLLGHHAGSTMSPGEVEAMARVNFAGPAAALAAAGDALARQGSGTVVVLSSVAAVRPRRSNYVYGASKAGLDAFAQGLGDALAVRGARVLVVRPGFVTSRMTEGLEPAPFHTTPAEVARRAADAIERGREVVWVPGLLGPMFAVLREVPRGLWRRIAGDR